MAISMRRVLGRGAVLAAAIGVIGVSGATLAGAEGQFTTKMSNVAAGFESRTWKDLNSDGWRTAIELTGCSANSRVAAPRLGLYRERFGPDSHYGTKGYRCVSQKVRGDWGRVRSGKYHFTVKNMGADWYRVSARKVQVFW
ncbi:hypothetical protein Skr01_13060 [Sphaerisporangium krabiense]|uniref:Uncharacterized protein n=1 Tax=Sphaerisporangium krabiense TaxID=763782 RepID=A0A7W8ZBV7_9ACTN|nr:hypothetical protein [Sphaerisporangium krabiense]MBB5631167.1 hypothetical protein [Sphaerisporangium krabiense]GII61221.1 hypothetical protein Skr01_13060 [Sphaerisporangium krabiense]